MKASEIVAAAIIAAILIWILYKVFTKPMKLIFKLIANSLIGFVILFLLKIAGAYIGIRVSVGIYSALIAGILGVPGIILLILIENLMI